MNWRIGAAIVTALGMGVAIGRCDPTESEFKRHAAVEMLRDQYLIDQAKALEPVNKRYRAKLETLKKDLTRKSDLEGVQATKAELEALDVGMASTGLVGDWQVTYSNGGKRNYRMNPNGTLLFLEEDKTCTPILVRDGWILDFNDGKADHIVVRPSLEVKHYESKAAGLKGADPTLRGTGVRTR
jgi:hypothetical protein